MRRAFDEWLPEHTNRFFAGTPVVKANVTDPSVENFSCGQVEQGDLVIVGINECPVEEQFIIAGYATHCFISTNNNVVLGAVWLTPCTDSVVIEHELIHTLCALHLESRPFLSLMGSPGGARRFTTMDALHLRYLYGRPGGVISPDNAWGLAPLEPRL